MAYKFNGGKGAVICDICHVIIDANLSYGDYEEIYENDGNDGDYCWKCKLGYQKVDPEK